MDILMNGVRRAYGSTRRVPAGRCVQCWAGELIDSAHACRVFECFQVSMLPGSVCGLCMTTLSQVLSYDVHSNIEL